MASSGRCGSAHTSPHDTFHGVGGDHSQVPQRRPRTRSHACPQHCERKKNFLTDLDPSYLSPSACLRRSLLVLRSRCRSGQVSASRRITAQNLSASPSSSQQSAREPPRTLGREVTRAACMAVRMASVGSLRPGVGPGPAQPRLPSLYAKAELQLPGQGPPFPSAGPPSVLATPWTTHRKLPPLHTRYLGPSGLDPRHRGLG